MMDFEKRREEIFRRGKKIIEKRKRRNKIIVAFVPFVLTAFILSVTVFPDLFLRKKSSYENLNSTNSSALNEEFELLSVLVEKEENQQDNPQIVINEAEKLLEISELLNLTAASDAATSSIPTQLGPAQTDHQQVSSSNRAEVSSKSSGTKGPASTYYLTLSYANGDEITYTLKANTLFSQYDVIKLSSDQASQLRGMFNLD